MALRQPLILRFTEVRMARRSRIYVARNYPPTLVVLSLKPGPSVAQDTGVVENLSTLNSGSDTGISVRNLVGSRRFSFVRFTQLTTLLPATAVLQWAKLFLQTTGTFSVQTVITVARILPANSAWGEFTATWDYAVDGVTRWAGDVGANGGTDAGCSVAGTDYSSIDMGSVIVPATTPTDITFEIPLDLTELDLMRTANHGFHLRSDTTISGNLTSADNPSKPEGWPELRIAYTMP